MDLMFLLSGLPPASVKTAWPAPGHRDVPGWQDSGAGPGPERDILPAEADGGPRPLPRHHQSSSHAWGHHQEHRATGGHRARKQVYKPSLSLAISIWTHLSDFCKLSLKTVRRLLWFVSQNGWRSILTSCSWIGRQSSWQWPSLIGWRIWSLLMDPGAWCWRMCVGSCWQKGWVRLSLNLKLFWILNFSVG